jgi:uncharacterized protein
LPRHAQAELARRLRAMPAVVVTGARQAGKSTLAQDLTPGVRRFVSEGNMNGPAAAVAPPLVPVTAT